VSSTLKIVPTHITNRDPSMYSRVQLFVRHDILREFLDRDGVSKASIQNHFLLYSNFVFCILHFT
jgi:hypothetical protein